MPSWQLLHLDAVQPFGTLPRQALILLVILQVGSPHTFPPTDTALVAALYLVILPRLGT